MASFLTNAAGRVVNRITISTELTGPVSFQPFAQGDAAPPPPQGDSFLMKMLKPQITLDTVAGPLSSAPYGKPTGVFMPVLLFAGVLMVVGAVATARTVAQAVRRR